MSVCGKRTDVATGYNNNKVVRCLLMVLVLCVVLASCGLVTNNLHFHHPKKSSGRHRNPSRSVPWRPPTSLPLNFRITTKIDLPDKESHEEEEIVPRNKGVRLPPNSETRTVPASSVPCALCGKPLPGFDPNSYTVGPGDIKQPGVHVWLWSTSEYSNLSLSTVEKGNEYTKSYHIYYST